MQSIQEKTKEIANKPEKKNIQMLIKQMEPEIKKALPTVITPERFTRIALSALSSTSALADCTPQSFLSALMTSAQLGMEVNTPLGQAYLIPFYNGKTKVMEVQFQLGYKGLIDLAYRSGEVVTVGAYKVCENDEFTYELGLEPKLIHKPAKENRGNPIYYYAIFRTKHGGYGFEVMSIEDINKHRDQFSKAAKLGFSPWTSNYDEMAKKTVLKKCLKYAPLKTDFARYASSDGCIKDTLSDDMFSEPAKVIQTEFAEEQQHTDAEVEAK